ncbi:hypothetical protein [Sinorhizobium americanum]|uniref:hypothetical protein n=1 Tax=Sinorhizobium americanum TaxID=194963 RepID=UPI0007DA4265|nr:hypothetical protein [Sinorhizobium americanum]OAP46494.1 hypothetical protein ATC00_05840 [Sinorhizobium americanum]
MSLHVSGIKGTVASFLAELGIIEPVADVSTPSLQSLSPERQLLADCYASGQIEEWAWQRHLDEDPVLAAQFRCMNP